MKTTLNTAARPSAPAPRPPVVPPLATRPVRRGSFWPGEAFAPAHRRAGLAELLASSGFILPALGSHRSGTR
jgi:hypothetical protein